MGSLSFARSLGVSATIFFTLSPRFASATPPNTDATTHTPAQRRHFVSGRVGLTGGLGFEYARDLHPVVQLAASASAWVVFNEAGLDLRLFFARVKRTRFYAGPGIRAQVVPLLFLFGVSVNAEIGLEYVDRRGFAFGFGLGAAPVFIPPGLPSEGSGFGGILPVVGIRLGRAWSL